MSSVCPVISSNVAH